MNRLHLILSMFKLDLQKQHLIDMESDFISRYSIVKFCLRVILLVVSLSSQK